MRVLVKDLSPGTTYALQLRSKSGTEVSDWSPVYNLTTTGDAVAPKVPTGAAWVVKGTSFLGTWNEVTQSSDDSAAHDLSHYLIKVEDGFLTLLYKTKGLRFDFTFEMNKAGFAAPRAAVTFSVAAVDITGNASAFTTPITATNPAPAQPANFVATGVQDAIILDWDAVSDDDLKVYRVHLSTVSAGFTPDSSNMIWEGLATNFSYPSVATGTDHYFKLAAVDVFNTPSTYAADDARPVASTAVDTTAPSTPTGFSVTGAMDSADASRANFTAVWTAVSAPDLQGYKIRFRPGSGAYQFVDIAADATTTIIPDLEVGITYDFQIMAYDFSANESAWSSIDSESVSNVAPSKPSAPTLVGSIQSFAVSHDMQKDAGGPLESDVTALQVYAGDTNVWATASPVLLETITVSQGSSVAVSAKIPLAIADGAPAKWIYIKAVDSKGLTSTESNPTSVSVASLTGTYIADATITSAKIQSLEANKIIAGSGIINDLLIKSQLMVDVGGKIKSKLYDTSAGASGFYLDDDELIIKSGAIEAAALKIQDSANMMAAQYAGFEFTPGFYIVRAAGGSADATAVIAVDGASIGGLAITAGSTQFKYEAQALQIVQTSGAARTIYLSNDDTTYNIETETAKKYIVSAWVRHNGGSNATAVLHINGNSYNQNTSLSIAGSTWTRISFLATIGGSAAKTNVSLEIPSTALTWWMDGVQVEEQIGASTTPSTWRPPGATLIDGGIIRTGEIRSSTTITVNGNTQPNWSINTQGKAQLGDVHVRGRIIVGITGGADGADSKIQSHDYVAGTSGWIIKSDGSAEFGNIDARGALKAGVTPGVWVMTRTHPDFPDELFADTDIKSAVISYFDTGEMIYTSASTDGSIKWSERGTVADGVAVVAEQLEQFFVDPLHFAYLTTQYDTFHYGRHDWESGSILNLSPGASLIVTDPSIYYDYLEVEQTAGNAVFFAKVPLESFHQFAINVHGVHEWGPGSAARDTNLYRHAANILRTDDTLRVGALTNDDDTGEVTISSIGSSWATTSGYATVRRWGKFVYVRWNLILTGSNLAANVDSTLFTLDTQYRPANLVPVTVSANISTATEGMVEFLTSGVCNLQNHDGINTNQRTAGTAMFMVA